MNIIVYNICYPLTLHNTSDGCGAPRNKNFVPSQSDTCADHPSQSDQNRKSSSCTYFPTKVSFIVPVKP